MVIKMVQETRQIFTSKIIVIVRYIYYIMSFDIIYYKMA